jgi:hypothetical protein
MKLKLKLSFLAFTQLFVPFLQTVKAASARMTLVRLGIAPEYRTAIWVVPGFQDFRMMR